jgi:hypothetical protein
MNENWETYLAVLSSGLNNIIGRDPKEILERANIRMQKKYPGPYIVEEFFNGTTLKFDLRLKFDDHKEHTMWLLKYT